MTILYLILNLVCKSWSKKVMKLYFISQVLLLIGLIYTYNQPILYAQPIKKGSFGTVETKIFSDELTYDIEKQQITFNKNVHVQRPDFQLTTDTLTIYLAPQKKSQKNEDLSTNPISSKISAGELNHIVAKNNVCIKGDKYTGTAGKVTYTEKTGILLLEDSPVLTDGENTITGDSIRYYIYENRSEVIRGKNKRVEATFSSSDTILK